MSNTNPSTNSEQLSIPNEITLYRLVAARLDLPVSQRLSDQNFKLSIIKQCWVDQLRLNSELHNSTFFILYFFQHCFSRRGFRI